jgi:hypothetical protein
MASPEGTRNIGQGLAEPLGEPLDQPGFGRLRSRPHLRVQVEGTRDMQWRSKARAAGMEAGLTGSIKSPTSHMASRRTGCKRPQKREALSRKAGNVNLRFSGR